MFSHLTRTEQFIHVNLRLLWKLISNLELLYRISRGIYYIPTDLLLHMEIGFPAITLLIFLDVKFPKLIYYKASTWSSSSDLIVKIPSTKLQELAGKILLSKYSILKTLKVSFGGLWQGTFLHGSSVLILNWPYLK